MFLRHAVWYLPSQPPMFAFNLRVVCSLVRLLDLMHSRSVRITVPTCCKICSQLLSLQLILMQLPLVIFPISHIWSTCLCAAPGASSCGFDFSYLSKGMLCSSSSTLESLYSSRDPSVYSSPCLHIYRSACWACLGHSVWLWPASFVLRLQCPHLPTPRKAWTSGPVPLKSWSSRIIWSGKCLSSCLCSPCDDPDPLHHSYTYAYTESDWASDIAEAAAQGLDGFVLNMGVDDWQPARIADAFTAAEASSTGFKLMISLDVSSLTCATSSDVTNLRALATAHSTSAAYLTMCTDGTALPMLSTFDGENCGFGEAGWNTVASGFYFAPGFFDISSTGWPTWDIVNAAFNVRCFTFVLIERYRALNLLQWNSAWPLTDTDISFDSDTTWIGDTPSGKGYVAAASPWFYTVSMPLSSYQAGTDIIVGRIALWRGHLQQELDLPSG